MINRFKDFLVEEEKTVFVVFGRMNPPTIGHGKLLDVLAKKAGRNPYKIFLSQSQDPKKNPLKYTDKVKNVRKMFPKHARSVMINKKVTNALNALSSLYDEGFRKVYWVAGSDRVNEYQIRLNKYNGKKGSFGFYNFDGGVQVISAGERDPDEEGATGASGTKQREFAQANNFPEFAKGLPPKMSNGDAKRLFNDVRKGMGLKEQKVIQNHVQLEKVSDKREQFVKGELFEVGDDVVIKATDEVARVMHLGSNYVVVESNGKTLRKWVDAVERIEEISKSTKDKRDAHFDKNADKADDDPSAYKPAPGDATAKTKTSKHTKKFKAMFGDD